MTASKEERLRKVEAAIFELMEETSGFGDEQRAEIIASSIDLLYAEEIGRLRADIVELSGEALHLANASAPRNATWETYARARLKWLASEILSLSLGLDDEGNGASNEDHGSSRRSDQPLAGLAPRGERQEP